MGQGNEQTRWKKKGVYFVGLRVSSLCHAMALMCVERFGKLKTHILGTHAPKHVFGHMLHGCCMFDIETDQTNQKQVVNTIGELTVKFDPLNRIERSSLFDGFERRAEGVTYTRLFQKPINDKQNKK